VPGAAQDSVQDLPRIRSNFSWAAVTAKRFTDPGGMATFRGHSSGLPRVQAICEYVHRHIAFDYQNARATRSAAEAFSERTGVCRDYAHLSIAFCRCMNIRPVLHGISGDVGTLPPYGVVISLPGSRLGLADAGISSIPAILCPAPRASSSHGPRRGGCRDRHYLRPFILESFRVWTDEIVVV